MLATVGAGRLVADLDWLDERSTDYLDLPLDLAQSESIQQTPLDRPLGVQSGTGRASILKTSEIRHSGPPPKSRSRTEFYHLCRIRYGDIRLACAKCCDDSVRNYNHDAWEDMVSGPDGVVVSGPVRRRRRIFRLALLKVELWAQISGNEL